MSEREELVKLTVQQIEGIRARQELNIPQESATIYALCDFAIAALSAQQEPTEPPPSLSGGYNYCCPSCGRNYDHVNTAPPKRGKAEKQLAEIVQVMCDNGIETPGWIEHSGPDGKLVRDQLTISATLMFWFDARAADQVDAEIQPSAPSDVMGPVKHYAPVMKAWNNYKAGDDFRNTRRWALHEAYVDGSLWAAFYAGYFACAVDSTAPSAPQSEQTHVRVPVDKLTISDCYRFGIDISSIRSTATGKESEHGN